MIVYISIIIFFVLWFFYRRKNLIERKYKKVKIKKLYLILLLLILIGFLLRLDYSELTGDLYYDEPIFDIRNIIFSSFSFGLILISLITISSKIRKRILIIESIVWLLKLLLFKGGYKMGFIPTVGFPIGIIVMFDFVSLLIRILIGAKLYNIKTKVFYFGLVTLIIISFKIFIPIQLCFKLNDFLHSKHAQETHLSMIGNWNGNLIYNSTSIDTLMPKQIDLDTMSLVEQMQAKDTLYIENEITICEKIELKIDSNYIVFPPNSFLSDTLIIDLQCESYGYVYGKNKINNVSFSIYIKSLSNDSLKIELIEMLKTDYILNLKKNDKLTKCHM